MKGWPEGLDWRLYVAAFGVAAVVLLLATPILALDNDLWFQLAHGREFWSTLEVPHDSYFSFIEPARERIYYSWLFQALIYPVYQATGYYGLIVLRALLFGLFLAALARLIAQARGAHPAGFWSAWLFALVASHQLFRFSSLRPHAAGYLMMAALLWLLESRSAKRWQIPLAAILWANFHGASFPVLWLILGAYGLEIVIEAVRGRTWPQGERRTRLLALLVAAAAVLVTPHGYPLLLMPLQPTYFASAYIGELGARPFYELFGYAASLAGPTHATTATLVLAWALLAAVGSGLRGTLRIRHLALLAGGVALLTQASRFTHEMTLLAVPLIAAHGPFWRLAPAAGDTGKRHLAAAYGLIAVLAAAPFALLAARWPAPQAYPLPGKGLPLGVAAFLEGEPDAAGKVMNAANEGGYLQWALPDRFRIYINMELPYTFLDGDLFALTAAFTDATALGRFLDRYQPDFVAAPAMVPYFPRLIAQHPHYRLVFFDDLTLLYADERRHPALVERRALRELSPLPLIQGEFAPLAGQPPERLAIARRELEAMEKIEPRTLAVALPLALLDLREGRPLDALIRAERALDQDPERSFAHALRGDALRAADPEAAIGAYRRAAALARTPYERGYALRGLAAAAAQQGDFAEAYRSLEAAIGRFNTEAPAGDLLQVGLLAFRAGRQVEARQWVEFAAVKTPADDAAAQQRLEEARRLVGGG